MSDLRSCEDCGWAYTPGDEKYCEKCVLKENHDAPAEDPSLLNTPSAMSLDGGEKYTDNDGVFKVISSDGKNKLVIREKEFQEMVQKAQEHALTAVGKRKGKMYARWMVTGVMVLGKLTMALTFPWYVILAPVLLPTAIIALGHLCQETYKLLVE